MQHNQSKKTRSTVIVKLKLMHLTYSRYIVKHKMKMFSVSQLLAFVNKRIVKFNFIALALYLAKVSTVGS